MEGIMRTLVASLAVATGLVALPAGAMAQTAGGWSGRATLYGWLPVVNGAQQGPDGEPVVDLETSDILSRLDMAAMGTFELRKGRLGLLLDAIYVDMSNDGDWLQDRVTVSTGTKLGVYTVAAAWRAWEEPRSMVDLYAGARFFDAKLDFGIATDRRGREASADLSWGDPLVGVRGAWALNDRWTLHGFADVGGFDGSSDLSWEVYGGASYAFNEHWEALAGYRYLSVLYQATDRAKLDISVQGPLVGVTYRF
jgi:opacity protein-like surface antigen